MSTRPPSPKEYLKAQRPERFSDSFEEVRPEVDRSFLEYHLDTLTSRSQETEFERFARRLAEREVCPNLRPQTGPTGGGDSKADAETYPVAEAITAAWYVGNGDEAGKERWAFAFSAKENWTGKVRSDVEGLVGTGRSYARFFFVTSRFTRDKTRASIEDELTNAHGVPVTILDRNWILDRVFSGRHQDLAVEELGVSGLRREQTIGPRDMERGRELEEVEARIRASLADGRRGPALVEDALRAADLVRMMEKPRVEVDGRYDRACRLADDMGIEHQRVRTRYEKAWTSYYWFEDVAALSTMYEEVERLALASRNIYDVELLSNLWTTLHGACLMEFAESAAVDLGPRRARLVERLRDIAADPDRPSAALQARTLLLYGDHLTGDKPDFAGFFAAARSIVEDSDGLVGFPLEPLVEIVRSFGEWAGEESGYDGLLEVMVERVSTRSSGIAAARLLVERGAQHVAAGRPAEAIPPVGRALGLLATHESRHDLSRALFVLGHAYEGMDLLWAARGITLSAASFATDELWIYGSTTPAQILCCHHLKLIELRLGRLPQVLAWHSVEGLHRSAAGRDELDDDDVQDLVLFDGIVAMQMLRADLAALQHMTFLPDALEYMSLDIAAAALRFALGHDGAFPEELTSGVPAEEFAKMMLRQPAIRQLRSVVDVGFSPRATYESQLLGCRIVVDTDRAAHCVAVAEALLASVEGLLAVGFRDGFVAREPILRVSVDVADGEGPLLSHSIVTVEGRHALEVASRPFNLWDQPRAEKVELSADLLKVAVHVVAYGFMSRDMTEAERAWFGKDKAFERAFRFTAAFGALSNTLGGREAYAERIDEWAHAVLREYPLLRQVPWDSGVSKDDAPDTRGAGDGSESEFDLGQIRKDFQGVPHSQVENLSVIRGKLWDAAGWEGMAFAVFPKQPPLIAFLFSDFNAGRDIFRYWRQEIGERDETDLIRVSLILGIDRSRPQDYRCHVTTNVKAIGSREASYMVVHSRCKTMNPSSDANLARFLEAYRAWGQYGLTCARYAAEAYGGMELCWDWIMLKRELVVRQAYEVGDQHDQDSAAIHADDDPILPSGGEAPVVALLSRLRSNPRR
jgi:hypothetical protein